MGRRASHSVVHQPPQAKRPSRTSKKMLMKRLPNMNFRNPQPSTLSRVLLVLFAFLTVCHAETINDVILRQLARMPDGGGYSVTSGAHQALRSSVNVEGDRATIRPKLAQPSYCSGATYLVFLMALQDMADRGHLKIDADTWQALEPDPMPDGQGFWGRWNANGPGTARLFHETGLGRNFTDFASARPGDFMKIFWTTEVGKNERGHSVVYLGTETKDGVEYVRYWSSNKPAGFGEKSTARSKMANVIFSRLERPTVVAQWAGLPKKDPYLASLLSTRSSIAEAKRLSGIAH